MPTPGGAIRPHSSLGDIPMCLHFGRYCWGLAVALAFQITQLPNYPITQSALPPPLDHKDHNIYWVSEGAITMTSQFLLGLSDSPCTKPSIHAAFRDFDLIISATIPASSQFLKDLADFVLRFR